MVLSEWDVGQAADVLSRALGRDHHASRHARYLVGYVAAVNRGSVGWAHWTRGRSPANRMCNLVERARESLLGHGEVPSERDFTKALTPIRTAGARLGLALPSLEGAAPGPGGP